MMHHPNMHHQGMSGHPPQHMPGHQGMPTHHQMPPHQLHRENRHVTLTRVPLGTGSGGGLGAGPHTPALGGLGMVHHQRPHHAIRPMGHHPPAQHHAMPQQMKPLRRQYLGGGYAPGAPSMPPPYAHEHMPDPPPQPQPPITSLCRPPSPSMPVQKKAPELIQTSMFNSMLPPPVATGIGHSPTPEAAGADGTDPRAAGDAEAARAQPAPANSKEKTPMCLVNELARYNKIKHQYRLTSETGPAHKKVFTVTLRLGDNEEYTAEGSSIKRAQHAAASAALSGTAFPPPPPRHHHHHPPAHHHHRHSVMPTVELNALAMKLCQPAVYTSVPPVPAPSRPPRGRAPPGYRMHPPFVPPYQRMLTPNLLYRVRVSVGGRAWLGEGGTPQAARHDAAARALQELRPPPGAVPPGAMQPGAVQPGAVQPGAVQPGATQSGAAQPAPAGGDAAPAPTAATAHARQANASDAGDVSVDILNSDVKSPVSLVHELALKRNLTVIFTVKSERGPPHMRVFITACTVGDMETEGEGNGKKVSKRRAAEKMLEEMRRRWPPALLRARPMHERRKTQPTKKKPRNLIKEGGGAEGSTPAEGGGLGAGALCSENPISRLAVARHAVRARSPQYRVIEERGAARRREFLVQCDAPPHQATGLGPNKKTAKRRAAHNVLLAMEIANANESTNANSTVNTNSESANSPESNKNNNNTTSSNNNDKRKEGGSPTSTGANGEIRQPVPGVLLMDYHQRSPQPNGIVASSGVSESSVSSGTGNSPGAKDHLMYLSQLLGFTVQFSDFPKRNHGEYLSLVSLSTDPPVMCHGGGASTQQSHEQSSRAALRALKLMGLDAPTTQMQNMPSTGTGSTPTNQQSVISNGIAE